MRTRHLIAAASLCTALIATSAVGAAVAQKHGPAKKPAHIALPVGWQPEGIAQGRGNDLFVGSIPTGAVLRVDARTGMYETAVPARAGHASIGLKATRHDQLFVAGGPTGKAFVYDGRTGAEQASFQLAPDATTFVNDVTLTKRWAYFTDSRRQVIYAVARDLSGAREIATPDIPLDPGNNLNGIAAAAKGRWLLAVQTSSGSLWRIDPSTGAAVKVDLGGYVLTNGDGLLLEGHTLYAVQNRSNMIAVLHMSDDFASGTLVKTITSTDFDVPTTIARQGKALFAVNARFGTTAPTPPAEADYWLTRVKP